jgi:hypothetical protein
MHRELIGDRCELRACNGSSAVILAVEGGFSGPDLADPAVTLAAHHGVAGLSKLEHGLLSSQQSAAGA